MNINIITAFTSARHKVFDILALDSNSQALPVTPLQKAVAKIWPVITTETIERGTIHLHEVEVKFREKYLRQGTIAMLSMYESSHALGKDSKTKPNHRQFYVNLNQSIRQLMDYAHKHNLKIGMPRIGSDRTWAEVESIIEAYAQEIGYRNNFCVFLPKSKR